MTQKALEARYPSSVVRNLRMMMIVLTKESKVSLWETVRRREHAEHGTDFMVFSMHILK